MLFVVIVLVVLCVVLHYIQFPPPRPIIIASGPLLTRVFGYLDFLELCKVSQVCKAWNETANQPFIWKTLFKLYDDRIYGGMVSVKV